VGKVRRAGNRYSGYPFDPLWISYWEPFHGANKKDFGFQVTVKVSAE